MKANNEKIDLAIQVMKRVQKLEEEQDRTLLDMRGFRYPFPNPPLVITTFDEAVNLCGTTCCFAGWLAIAPEFPELIPDVCGAPIYHGYPEAEADDVISDVLQVDKDLVSDLIYGCCNYDVQEVIHTLEGWKS